MSKRLLTIAAFRAWLETKHPRTKIGTSQCADSCPLAKFLTQTTGKPYNVGGEVEDCAVQVDSDQSPVEGTEIALPMWAVNFIGVVDNLESEAVSAARALQIVNRSRLGRSDFNTDFLAERINNNERMI